MFEDGIYEALIVDAEALEGEGDGAVRAEITITSGPHKGEVVAVRGRFPGRSDVDLLAAPARLSVVDGRPTVTLDD